MRELEETIEREGAGHDRRDDRRDRCRARAASSCRRRATGPAIAEVLKKHDILLIVDEVICGFGRTGKMFGMQQYGVAPDIVSFAKGITSGYIPLGGVGVTR